MAQHTSDPQSLSRALLARSLLEWYDHIGVDEALDPVTTDWYGWSSLQKTSPTLQGQTSTPLSDTYIRAANHLPQTGPVSPTQNFSGHQTAPKHTGPTQVLPPAPVFSHLSTESAAMAARDLARTAKDLDELEHLIRSFEGCALKATAKNTCISRGTRTAPVMLIGEAPGRDEDLQGLPFVGRAGQLLDKMLASIGLDEKNVYITNTVYWRPPGNRTPTLQEAEICRPFLDRQIELIAPQLVVFLGGVAAKHMLATSDGIMKLRGKWKKLKVGDKEYKALATLHPAYLLRNPADKRKAWQDLLTLKQALDQLE